MTKTKTSRTLNKVFFLILCALTVVVLYPLFFIVNNSFKGKFFISKDPFSLPNGETFSGITNYVNGLIKTGLLSAIGWSFFITIVSVIMLILFTSMTAYYITRVKSRLTSGLYYMFAFSTIVPFQMVMFTMSSLADTFHLKILWECVYFTWDLAQDCVSLCFPDLSSPCLWRLRRRP